MVPRHYIVIVFDFQKSHLTTRWILCSVRYVNIFFHGMLITEESNGSKRGDIFARKKSGKINHLRLLMLSSYFFSISSLPSSSPFGLCYYHYYLYRWTNILSAFHFVWRYVRIMPCERRRKKNDIRVVQANHTFRSAPERKTIRQKQVLSC